MQLCPLTSNNSHNYADFKRNAPSQLNEYWPGWNSKLVESGLADKVTTIGKHDIILNPQCMHRGLAIVLSLVCVCVILSVKGTAIPGDN